MKGDFSGNTFNPRKHYVGVLHQQGRVSLDSDWNESVQERLSLMQKQLADVVGPGGMASPNAFQISPGVNPGAPDDFQISAGHAYVNGILCRLEANTSYKSQPDFPDAPSITMPAAGATAKALVYLETWQRLITCLEDKSIADVALGGVDTSARIRMLAQIKVTILPSSAGNVTADQAAQFLPFPGKGTLTTLQPQTAPAPGQTISAAIGGGNHLYRVQIHDAGDVTAGTGVGGASVSLPTVDAIAGATTLSISAPLNTDQVNGALRTGFVTVSDLTGALERVPLAGVSNNGQTLNLGKPLVNSYRVAGGAQVAAGFARVKWSRNNAAFAVGVTAVQPDLVTLTLSKLGRDTTTALHQGDIVEITDDASELGPGRGHLTLLVSDPDPDQFTVVLADALPSVFHLTGVTSPPSPLSSSRNLVLRRWDGVTDVAATAATDLSSARDLGNGVRIIFGGSNLGAGDYWQFTTRAADGSVQSLVNAPPAGERRFRIPLALVSWSLPALTSPPASPPPVPVMTVTVDCRRIFQSLVNLPAADKGIRVSGISVLDPAGGPQSPLFNDSNIKVSSFGGINILCTDSVSLFSSPACGVSVESPVDLASQGGGIPGYFPASLPGSVSVQGKVITWLPAAPTQTYLNKILTVVSGDRGILARLTLKGNFIWSQNDPAAFLDGEVFGSHSKGQDQTSGGVLRPIVIFNTGTIAAGTLAPDSAVDSHYTLVGSADPGAPGPGVFVAAKLPSPWVANGPNSKWIAPVQNPVTPGLATGAYRYRTVFDLTGLDPSTATLTGQWGTDDTGVIQLNGVGVANSASGSFQTLTPFAITSGFIRGLNTLDFVVNNVPTSPTPTGLRVEISGSALDDPTAAKPIPIFSTGIAGLAVPAPDSAIDSHYTLIATADLSAPGPQVFVANKLPSTWVPNGTSAKWIAPLADPTTTGLNPGIYRYRTTFDLTGLDPATALLSGQWGSDNVGVMQINGITVANSASSGFQQLTSFVINSGFVSGVNVLDFIVTNLATTPNPTGLRVEIAGTAKSAPSSNVSLILPSGNRIRGGNFQMWFWLVPAPVFIVAIQAVPAGPVLTGAAAPTAIVLTLSGPAPAAVPPALTPVTVTVTIGNPAVLQEVASPPPGATFGVLVPAGSSTATFFVTGLVPGQTDLQASYGGRVVATVLTVVSGVQNFILSVTSPSQTVAAGDRATFSVTVSPLNGFNATVSLSVTGAPAQAAVIWSQSSITGGTGTATLTVATSPFTASGSNTLTIVGVSSSGSHNVAVTLIVIQSGPVILRPTQFIDDTTLALEFPGSLLRDRPAFDPDARGIFIAPDIDQFEKEGGGVVFLGRVPFKDPANAFDGNPNTFAWADSLAGCTWFSWNAPSRNPATVTLKVLSQVVPPGAPSLSASVAVLYSTDGGNSFPGIVYRTASGRPLTTDSIALPVNTDLTKVQVRANYVGQFEAATVQIFEIWVEITV